MQAPSSFQSRQWLTLVQNTKTGLGNLQHQGWEWVLAHTSSKEGAQTSWVQWGGHKTPFYPYVKGDDKHHGPLIESCHRPYGDIWLGGEIIRPSKWCWGKVRACFKAHSSHLTRVCVASFIVSSLYLRFFLLFSWLCTQLLDGTVSLALK